MVLNGQSEENSPVHHQHCLWQMRRRRRRLKRQRRWKRQRRPSSCCAFQFASFVRSLFSVNKFRSIGHFIHSVAVTAAAAAAVATCYAFQLNRSIRIVNVTSTIQLLTVCQCKSCLASHFVYYQTFTFQLFHSASSTALDQILAISMPHETYEHYHGKTMTVPHTELHRTNEWTFLSIQFTL